MYGRYLYALGGNRLSAKRLRISERRYWVGAYGISGGVSALTGELLLGWSGGGFIGVGQPYLFMTLAAVVIGGTSLSAGLRRLRFHRDRRAGAAGADLVPGRHRPELPVAAIHLRPADPAHGRALRALPAHPHAGIGASNQRKGERNDGGTQVLQATDVTGGTFSLALVGMIATAVLLLLGTGWVSRRWKLPVALAAPSRSSRPRSIRGARSVDVTGQMPVIYRYVAWMVTVPIQVAILYFFIGTMSAPPVGLFWRLLVVSVVMVLVRYMGEVDFLNATLAFLIGIGAAGCTSSARCSSAGSARSTRSTPARRCSAASSGCG